MLLDALDEDIDLIDDKKYLGRIREIIECVIDFKKIIITARVQFFDENREKLFKSSLPRLLDGGGDKSARFGIEKLYVSFFSEQDIREFLKKKLGRFSGEMHQVLQLLKSQHNIFHRPLILKNIELLIGNNKKYWYNFEIYETLINELIRREAGLINDENIYKTEILRFSKLVAKELYLSNKGSSGFTSEQVLNLSNNNNIQLSDFEQICRSFISKNASGLLDFSHKSFFEYFLALNLIEDNDFRRSFKFTGFDFAYMLYKELIFEKKLKTFFANDQGYELEIFINNGRYIKLDKGQIEMEFIKTPGQSTSMEDLYEFIKTDFNYKLLDNICLVHFDVTDNRYFPNKDFETILLSLNRIDLKADFSAFEAILYNEVLFIDEKIASAEIYYTTNRDALKNLRIIKKNILSNISKIKNIFKDSKTLCSKLIQSNVLISEQ